MSPVHHRHHGKVSVGRVMVAAACLLFLGANGLIFKEASGPPRPIPALRVITAISLIWMFAGAGLMCLRRSWGRYLVLTILYVSTFGYFVTVVISMSSDESDLQGRLRPIIIGTAIYLFLSLALTHSRHVRRLTSRAWD